MVIYVFGIITTIILIGFLFKAYAYFDEKLKYQIKVNNAIKNLEEKGITMEDIIMKNASSNVKLKLNKEENSNN